MKMRRNFFRCGMLCMLALSMMLTSCLQEEDIVEKVEDKYNHDFKETFGKVDPNHTWSTADLGNVTATIGGQGDYTLKLYTSNPRNTNKQAYLLAKFNVKGGEHFNHSFDMPASIKNVYASLVDKDGYRSVTSSIVNKGKVHFDFSNQSAASRTTYPIEDEIVKVEQTDWYTYGYEDVKVPLQVVPEGDGEKVDMYITKNFLYQSTGEPIYISPLYFQSNRVNMDLGIYYYDENKQPKKVKIWNKSEDIGQYKYEAIQTWTPQYQGDSGTKHNSIEWTNINNLGDISQIFASDGEKKLDWGDAVETKNSQIRFKGMKIEIPEGTKYGFYIESGGTTHYSEKHLNTQYVQAPEGYAFGATFQHSHYHGEKLVTHRYLTFEDCPLSYDGFDQEDDYNDLVLMIRGAAIADSDSEEAPDIIIIDEDKEEDVPMTYIVAYEDLGVNDFDFNDVILGIQYATTNETEKQATFKLMAAGGTLPIKVKYNNQMLWENIHTALGGESGKPINVFGNKTDKAHVSQTLDVATDFTVQNNASLLTISVTRKGIEVTDISIPDPTQAGGSPQAFLVADAEWNWPTEGKHITSAYPEFTEWVSDKLSDNWYDASWGEEGSTDTPEGEGGNTETPGDNENTEEEDNYPEEHPIYGIKVNLTSESTIAKSELGTIAQGDELYFLTNGELASINGAISTNNNLPISYNMENANPYIFTEENISILNTEGVTAIKLTFWSSTPEAIYIKHKSAATE